MGLIRVGWRGVAVLWIGGRIPRIRFAPSAACLITDILMPKMSGLELQARLKDEECDIPIILITAYGDASMRIQAMREGAVEFLAKPFDHHLLLKTVRAALDM
jgi:FixJ family two-component response regulator